jgi:hypothetical protein
MDASVAGEHNRLRNRSSKRYRQAADDQRRMGALEIAALLPRAPEPDPPQVNKVRKLFRLPIEAPRAIAETTSEFEEETDPKWRRYVTLKAREDSLDEDNRAWLRIYEGSAAYRARIDAGWRAA